MKFGFIAKPRSILTRTEERDEFPNGNQSFSNLEEILNGAPDRMKLGTVM